MNSVAKYTVISLLVLMIGGGLTYLLIANGREAEKVEREVILRAVEVLVVEPASVNITVPSQGEVKPTTRTQLTAEVGGKVIRVAENLKAGMTVSKGEVLLVIDPTNYQALLAQAKANEAEAKLALVNEQARVDQAKRDWERLGEGRPASDLVLRKPQLESASAIVKSAVAAVDKAEADLRRSEIRAPYDGVVEMRSVDLGAYVPPGTPVATIYQSGAFEIRLPVSIREAQFVKEPSANSVDAEISSSLGESSGVWKAKVVRSEAMIDPRTRSIYLVAEVHAEGMTSDEGVSLMPNLFVQAKVDGKTFDNVIRVPRRSVYGVSRVLTVDDDDRLRFREVKVLWETADEIIVTEGLNSGDRVCLTSFSDVVEGTKVEVAKSNKSSDEFEDSETVKGENL